MNITQDTQEGTREVKQDAQAKAGPPTWLDAAGIWGFRFVWLAAGIAVVLFVLFQLRVAVLPVFMAILIATLVAPIAFFLRRFRVPRALASALAVLLCLGLLTGAGIFIGVAVAGEFGQLGTSAERGYRQVVEQVARLAGVAPTEIQGWVDDHLANLQSFGGIAKTALNQVRGLVEALTVVVLTIVFVFLFAWDGDRQFEYLVRLLPSRRQQGARELGSRIWVSVGGYMRGMFLIATADALLLGLGYWIIGMPLIPPLMLLLFLGAFVPFVGPILAATVAALVGMADGDMTMTGLAVGIAFLVQQIEGNLLQPLLMGRAVELHPSIILFAATAGGVLGGVAGIFLAIPVATTIATTFAFIREKSGADPSPSVR